MSMNRKKDCYFHKIFFDYHLHDEHSNKQLLFFPSVLLFKYSTVISIELKIQKHFELSKQ